MTMFHHLEAIRLEVVTTTFVASGSPAGIHELGRLMETLNNPALSGQFELQSPVVRPLYRAGAQLELGAPLLVRRDDIIFANFEGPQMTHDLAERGTVQTPVLLMAPPFQVQGLVRVLDGADATQALRALAERFFVVTGATVYDAEGAVLGEGEHIIINGTAVQMMSATTRHIETASPVPAAVRRTDGDEAEDAKDERAARAA